MELILTASIDFVIVAFTLVMVIDFLTGLRQLWADPLALGVLRFENEKPQPALTLELSAPKAESNPLAFETPMVEALYTTKSTMRASAKPTTPVDLPSSHPADEGVLIFLTPLEVVAEERVLTMAVPLEVVAEERVSSLSIPLEVVADPWAAEEEPNLSQHPCYCHTAIATPPQLLLPPGLEVANQPELATLPNTELRKLCQSAGIRWRNAHGTNKHLSKNQMITALG